MSAGTAISEARREDWVQCGRKEGKIVRFVIRVETSARAESDIALYLSPGSLDVLGRASDLETRLPVTGRGHDVGVSNLLDPLDRGTFWPYDQTNDSIRHPDQNGDLVLLRRSSEGAGRRSDGAAPARGADLREVLGRCENLPLRSRDVLGAAGDDKDGFLAANRRLYVCVRLGSQRLDLAA